MCGHETRTISDTLPRAPGGGRVGPVREVLGGTPAGPLAQPTQRAHSGQRHTHTQTASAPAQTCAKTFTFTCDGRYRHKEYAEESWRDWH